MQRIEGSSLVSHAIRASAIFAVGFIAVFFIAGSGIETVPKALASLAVFAVAVFLVLVILPAFANGVNPNIETIETVTPDGAFEEELTTLEEAAVFFSASMQPDEMLRLVAARLEGVVADTAVDFYLPDGENNLRSVKRAARTGSTAILRQQIEDLVLDVFESGSIGRADFEKSSGAGVPLLRGDEVVSVCLLTAEELQSIPADNTLRTIASRIEPLIAGSLSFSSSVSNALTDTLTNLPNERAMYLILENQVAEAQRFGPMRPLSVMAIDIHSFDEINRRFGHATGDRLLGFTGNLIREQLRKMDFIARTSDDEFFLILPTAEGLSAENVKKRIVDAFESEPFLFTDDTREPISLCFGIATFGNDGDTGSSLIRSAVEKKQIDKSSISGSVIAFPGVEKDS